MVELKTEQGGLITDSSEILKEQARFYAKLYRNNPQVQFTLENHTTVKLTEAQCSNLDKPITLDEIRKAVLSLKKEKTPGLDGLSAEFFQHFWGGLESMYYELLTHAIEVSCLPRSTRRGVITLIPKKGRDPLLLKNWRPITLLNTDYKILAKIIATRIQRVLPDLISLDQTGFMTGRQITTTIRKTMDIVEYCDRYDQPGYVINLDFQKCFDQISYSAIIGSLKYFGFGPYLTGLVSLLLMDFWSCTCNNGYTSNYFKVERSCHQGDPVVPYLYLLCGEVMALTIKQNEKIRGITIYKMEQILSQFADDTQLFASDGDTVNEYISVLDIVYVNTGLTVNYEKSSIHCVGGAQVVQVNQNFEWSNEKPCILGVNTAVDHNLAFEEIVNKMENVANRWYNQSLTLMGKILVVNMLMGSLFVYKMFTYATLSTHVLAKFYDVVNKFIWKGKKSKVRTQLLMAPKHRGGLKVINMGVKIAAQKISWLFRDDLFVKNWIQSIIPSEMGFLFFDCNLDTKDLDPVISNSGLFWHQVLEAWFSYKYCTVMKNKTQAANQIIWYNSMIKVDGKILINKSLCDEGMLFLKDILNDMQTGFKTFAEISEQFVNLDWLVYQQIVSAIPLQWKKVLLVNQELETYVSKWDHLSQIPKVTSYIYNEIIDKNNDIEKIFCRISHRIDFEDTSEDFANFLKGFREIYRVMNIVKYRDFQYRLMVNDIHCNNRLYYWNCAESRLCEICNQNKVQTVRHLLFDCSCAKQIWSGVRKFVETLTHNELEWDYRHVFMNRVHTQPGHVINFIVLLMKHMIFAFKCRKKKLTLSGILLKLEDLYLIERSIAYKNGNLNKHKKKWKIIFPPTEANEVQ